MACQGFYFSQNISYPAALAPGAHLSTASRSPSPFQRRRRLSATCDINCNKMAPLKGELGAKRSEGFFPKGLTT